MIKTYLDSGVLITAKPLHRVTEIQVISIAN